MTHPINLPVAEPVEGSRWLSAMQVAHQYGLSYQTVNYYTNLGLLVAVRRQGHHRLYEAAQTERRLRAIASLKLQGYPLKLIGQQLAAAPSG